ncbi:MAG: hypothetical protein ACI9NN_002122, partial [Bacteroidia bacterium]
MKLLYFFGGDDGKMKMLINRSSKYLLHDVHTGEPFRLLADSNSWFKRIELDIAYPHIDYERKFKGFSAIYKFIEQTLLT